MTYEDKDVLTHLAEAMARAVERLDWQRLASVECAYHICRAYLAAMSALPALRDAAQGVTAEQMRGDIGAALAAYYSGNVILNDDWAIVGPRTFESYCEARVQDMQCFAEAQ